METPIVQALLVCDQVITDEQTKRKSLINILNHIHGKALPLTFPRLTVFATLTNGNGQMTVELRCAKVDTDVAIFGAKGPLVFPNPNAVVDLVFQLNNLSFKEPGAYAFMLYCNEDLVAERRFAVKLAPPRTPPAQPNLPNLPES